MNAINTSRVAKSIIERPLLWSLAILILLVAAIVSASTPLLIVSGVLGFGRPLLYSALLNSQAGGARSAAADGSKRLPFEQRSANAVSALGVF